MGGIQRPVISESPVSASSAVIPRSSAPGPGTAPPATQRERWRPLPLSSSVNAHTRTSPGCCHHNVIHKRTCAELVAISGFLSSRMRRKRGKRSAMPWGRKEGVCAGGGGVVGRGRLEARAESEAGSGARCPGEGGGSGCVGWWWGGAAEARTPLGPWPGATKGACIHCHRTTPTPASSPPPPSSAPTLPDSTRPMAALMHLVTVQYPHPQSTSVAPLPHPPLFAHLAGLHEAHGRGVDGGDGEVGRLHLPHLLRELSE